MKKVLSFVGCAFVIAAMTVACNNNKQQPVEEPVVDEQTIEEAVQEVSSTESEAVCDASRQAMLDAAAEAGRAKCNCYKTDAASVESCIKSILTESYAQYEGNDEFKSAMEAEFQSCVKEKATAAAAEAADKAIAAGANAIADKLKK